VAGTGLVDRLAEHKTLGAAPREELAWLAAHGVLQRLDDGELMVAAGAPVDGLFILLTGHVDIFIDRGAGRHKVMDWRAGDVTGVLPYSRMVNSENRIRAFETQDVADRRAVLPIQPARRMGVEPGDSGDLHQVAGGFHDPVTTH
jgi:CRP-like cAMP-binding protein